MPVSYVSDVIRSNPFIQPFDVNLMEKVNSYKQSLFYQNAAKTENMITQLNNTDIANPQQREFLKNKVNDLTTQLNNTGAINYSDMNVANTIEGFGSDIYNDPNIMNGIVSTNHMRQWQNNVQKLKTDPKLNKYYSGANEAWDMEHYVKPYVSGGIDSTYDGPTAPKPYTGNPFTKALDVMKNIRPDIETRIDPVTGNQFFFSKTEKRALSSDSIAATLDGLIDGDTKQQLKIDSWYNYDYSTGNKFNKADGIDIYTQDLDNALSNRNAQIAQLNDQIAVEPDLNKKKQYEDAKAAIQDEVSTYTKQRASMVSDFGKDWDASPENAKYKLYMRRFYNDVVKAAGYDETKMSLIKNEKELFTARQQLEYTKAGLWWDGISYNHDGTPQVLPVEGAEHMRRSNGTTNQGKTKLDVSNGLFHDLTVNTENSDQAAAHKVTEQTLIDDNKTIDGQLNTKMQDFLRTVSKRGGYDLGFVDTPEKNAASSAVISISPLLTAIQNVGDKSTLSRDDIKYVLDRVNEQNTTGKHPAGGYSVPNGNGQYIGITENQVNFFKNVMKNWDAVATGQLKSDDAPMNISVSDLSKFITDYQTLNMVKQSNLSYIQSVEDKVLKDVGLTPEEKQLYADGIYFAQNTVNDENGNLISRNPNGPDDRILKYFNNRNNPDVQKKLRNLAIKTKNLTNGNYQKKIDDEFANASNRDNYYSLYLPDAETMEKVAPGLLAKIRAHSVTDNTYSKNLKPEAISRTEDGKFSLTYTFDDNKEKTHRGQLTLEVDEAVRLGGELYPNEPLERLLNYQTSTGPLYTYSSVFKQPIKYSIERETNNRNGRTYVPYIYYNNEKIPIFATDKQGFQGSANAAEYLLKQYISNNAFSGISMDQFLTTARKLSNQ